MSDHDYKITKLGDPSTWPQPFRGPWGKWTFDQELNLLDYDNGSYGVDLEEAKTCAEALDWIAQVARKPYVTNEDLGNLIRAMNDILNFQGNYCGGGVDLTVEGK